MSDERCMKDSMRPMMILRNNQGDYLRVGFSKQSRSCVLDFQPDAVCRAAKRLQSPQTICSSKET